MSSIYTQTSEGISNVNYKQTTDSSEEKLKEVDQSASNPIILPDPNNEKWTSDFDMLEEGLW
jgi:hypothetical protein